MDAKIYVQEVFPAGVAYLKYSLQAFSISLTTGGHPGTKSLPSRNLAVQLPTQIVSGGSDS